MRNRGLRVIEPKKIVQNTLKKGYVGSEDFNCGHGAWGMCSSFTSAVVFL